MHIQIDTREKTTELKRIIPQLEALGVKWFKSKLYIADYMNLDNPRVVVDRKVGCAEIIQNVCQQHERFQKELMRARDAGIHIVFLIEGEATVKTLEDVKAWQNPRRLPHVEWVGGIRQEVIDSPNALTGEQLYKALCTIKNRYGVEFLFCSKEETGRRIVEILTNDKESSGD